MTGTTPAALSRCMFVPARDTPGDDQWGAAIKVAYADLVWSFCTLAVSLAGLLFAMMSPFPVLANILVLATATLIVPIVFLITRLRRGGELTIPVLLTVTSLTCVARDRIVHLYDDLNSGRLPHRPGAEVPRFRPILHGTSTDEQQRVLGVLGRRYHADFRAALRDALRNKNSFIRAQAAAVASRLDAEEKNKLWSSASPAGTPDAP
jgi:HEAT repeat protein